MFEVRSVMPSRARLSLKSCMISSAMESVGGVGRGDMSSSSSLPKTKLSWPEPTSITDDARVLALPDEAKLSTCV